MREKKIRCFFINCCINERINAIASTRNIATKQRLTIIFRNRPHLRACSTTSKQTVPNTSVVFILTIVSAKPTAAPFYTTAVLFYTTAVLYLPTQVLFYTITVVYLLTPVLYFPTAVPFLLTAVPYFPTAVLYFPTAVAF